MTEDEMVGQHHQLDGHEFEQTLRAGDGQGSLECCSPWDRKEPDTTEQLNCTESNIYDITCKKIDTRTLVAKQRNIQANNECPKEGNIYCC